MCDLFALSAGADYSAPKALPIFAARAGRNMDGWGIGYFKKHQALVEKSAQSVYLSGRVHDSFQRLARVVNSRIIISHVRFRTSGPIDECHAHPFILSVWWPRLDLCPQWQSTKDRILSQHWCAD